MKQLFVVLLACISTSAFADSSQLQQQFDTTVKPLVTKYCVGCHSGAQPTAQFDLKSYTSVDQVKEDFPRWSLLADRLTAHEMPPKQMPQPSVEDAQKIIDWVHAVRSEEIKRLGGDPGTVLARRLSNAEYNYTIRDLTGQDMDLTRQFPVDPANPAGFDNSGESLTMSPALLNKYLQAARQVADHMVLKPGTIDFAPHMMAAESDHDKYAIGRIIAFYKAQPTDYADYFQAAWRYRYRAALGKPNATLASIAADTKVSAKYLPLVWSILHDKNAVGPVAKLQGMWNALPVPRDAKDDQFKSQTQQMRDFVVRIRAHTAMQFAAPKVKGLPGKSQPLHNWRLQRYAEGHRQSDPNDLRADNEVEKTPPAIPKFPGSHADTSPHWAIVSAHARFGDNDLVYPAGQKARYQKSFARFASVFPDTFYVSERGRYWPDNSTDQGRLLSAGYHNTGGYYRDDTALMQLILDKKGQDQLNRLWNEFDFVAHQTERTWVQYFFNQSGEIDGDAVNGPISAESGSKRPVGHEVTDQFVIFQMRDKYLARWAMDRAHNDPVAPKVFQWHFGLINTTLRNLEKQHAAAEPKHLAVLIRFTERAYRRPLTAGERADVLAYYKTLRTKKLSHEDAIRDTIVSVLMSPDFLYRFDLSKKVAAAKPALVKTAMTKPFVSEALSDYGLASRLSYFLWSSMPDAELMKHAAAGDLHRPDVLRAQARRMLKDSRIKGLATEFTGNWLVFRHFETNNSVDRQRFPAFDDDLRKAMFQEPIRFMQDAITHDGSMLDLLYGNYTFVNPQLARFYGMPTVAGDENSWARVDNADKYGRGGILPMAVFMTQYSPGLRTSPVKRGNWVVQKVLGMKVPPPPPAVPELPSDESKTDLPIRAMLEQHRKNPFCAGCHQRFDSFGLVFEGYGPVGNARTTDMAGRPVDASATFPGGVDATGVPGLQAYIREHRQDRYVENLCRKLLSYALNRSLQLSDEALVDKMKPAFAADGYRFRALVEAIVMSPQFLNRRLPQTAEIKHASVQPADIDQIKAYLRGN
ncbi:MAG TPA: DUF1592 domain-containing protein [Rhizomicrobium sp.]|nr:DUF1592 domain-containing protein [Rhizomicrobium sp.]